VYPLPSFLAHPDFRDDCCRALYEHKLSLREFADLDWMCTLQPLCADKVPSDFAFIGLGAVRGITLRFYEQFGGVTELPIRE